ncbi:MAG: hypothetical protein M3Z54_13480 [Gemmatimonadota bacterium]|nr:hypothetical protein [Gemmatimonadota bacterium]
MARNYDMEDAFAAALTHVERSLASGMKAADGSSAQPQLARLQLELKLQRDQARERGAVDHEWLQKTVRWVAEWVPEKEITLIAALGRIVRAAPPALS